MQKTCHTFQIYNIIHEQTLNMPFYKQYGKLLRMGSYYWLLFWHGLIVWYEWCEKLDKELFSLSQKSKTWGDPVKQAGYRFTTDKKVPFHHSDWPKLPWAEWGFENGSPRSQSSTVTTFPLALMENLLELMRSEYSSYIINYFCEYSFLL